ncbi:MAG: hypothetical protein EOM80_09070 [Erysipelotrichia bacterium]|nr:hypothetical protein [Erysipelotrichia bacterium]
MEEFMERVSDIERSPVILEIWQSRYRQILKICLVCFAVLLCASVKAEEEKISRHDFISSAYERIYNRRVSELEAVNSGLLDSFDDGTYHLEWPVSRGMAAEALYRLSIQAGTAVKLPRAFADVAPGSSFEQPLKVVGGAFLPKKRGNFDPNYLLDRPSLFRSLKILLEKGVLKQEDRSDMSVLPVYEPVSTVIASGEQSAGELYSIKPELGFKEQSTTNALYKADTYARISRADSQVTAMQINPQSMASIEDATSAMQDVEAIIERLGGSVMEMTSTYPSNPEDEQVLRQGLAQIESVLSTVLNRFEYSKQQLTTVMPVDPDQIQKCDLLNSRLDSNIDQARVLKKRIAARLAEPQKEAEE